MSDEEKVFYDAALASLDKESRENFLQEPLDVLLIVRGCANEENRLAETIKMIKFISEWRNKVGYYNFFQSTFDGDELFHQLWPEYICGNDKFGHFIQALRVEEIDSDGLLRMDETQLIRLQGQKMRAYAAYKRDLSKLSGAQRYKHTVLLDLHHVSMSMLVGGKKALLRRIIDVNSAYFPETVFKFYLINAPLVFRAVWAAVKPWLHPETVAKINILGSSKDALRRMEAEGVPPESLPPWAGGTGRPVRTFDYLRRLIALSNGRAD